MCGMATLTIDVSISSSTAASVTAMAMRYLYLYLSSAATSATGGGPERSVTPPFAPPGRMTVVDMWSAWRRLLHDGVCDHRHAGAQRPVLAESLRHPDAHGHALHDLGEVAGGVVRREQRELGARRGAHALDLPLRRHAAIGVDLQVHV